MPDKSKTKAHTQAQEFRPMFTTTCWTAVVKAGRNDSLEAKDALSQLCSTYWQPLHAYLRRVGQSEADAKDLTQEFFYVLLSKNYLNAADRTKGKFRTFLLTALKHFLSNQRDRANALKRGGGKTILSLDEPIDDDGHTLDPGDDISPSTMFERQWATTLFRKANRRLREDYVAQGKAELFDRLTGYLEGETKWGEYAEVAKDLGMTSAAVAMAVSRLRHRYAQMLREEVAETLVNPTHTEIEQELEHLFDIFAQ